MFKLWYIEFEKDYIYNENKNVYKYVYLKSTVYTEERSFKKWLIILIFYSALKEYTGANNYFWWIILTVANDK